MILVAFILACYGLTNILLYAKILEKIRPDWYVFRCSMCMGVWSGLVINILFWMSEHQLGLGPLIPLAISSASSYILDKVITDKGIAIRFTNG